jgi:hypothetical protein
MDRWPKANKSTITRTAARKSLQEHHFYFGFQSNLAPFDLFSLIHMEYIEIQEMTTVPERVHCQGPYKFQVHQSDIVNNHWYRIKIFKLKDNINSYSIDIIDDVDDIAIRHRPNKISDQFLSKDERKIITYLKKYKNAYLDMCKDPLMTLDELEGKIEQIDNNIVDNENK